MEASTPRSPSQASQASQYEHSFVQSPYAHSSTYPSPAKTEADASRYLPDGLSLYNYPISLPSQSVNPAQTLYPLSPHPSEPTWTPALAAGASPSMMEGQQMRPWNDHYESVGRSEISTWEAQFQYGASGPFVETRHSPAPSEGYIISQRSSVSSTYDHHSLYSQESSESAFLPQVKREPQAEWFSDHEDSVMGHPPLTVSPGRLGKSNDAIAQRYSAPAKCKLQLNTSYKVAKAETSTRREAKINTSTARTRSRSTTTPANANYKCETCGRLFQRNYNHKAHMVTHDPDRPLPNVCQTETCGRAFARRTDLQRHELSVHIKAKNHKCIACGAHFARKDTLRRHTEDGCPKRCDTNGKLAQRQSSGRRRSALPVDHHGLPLPHQPSPQGLPLGHSTPYFQPEAFPPSPQ